MSRRASRSPQLSGGLLSHSAHTTIQNKNKALNLQAHKESQNAILRRKMNDAIPKELLNPNVHNTSFKQIYLPKVNQKVI